MLRNTVEMSIELAIALNEGVESGNVSLEEAQERVKVSLLEEMNDDGTRPINNNIDLGEMGYFIIYNKKGLEVAQYGILKHLRGSILQETR